jgi:6-phosphogluconolactonase (cycloisomerase 2 family)
MTARALLIAVLSLFIGLFSPASSQAQSTLTIIDNSPFPGAGDVEFNPVVPVSGGGRFMTMSFDSGEAVTYEVSRDGKFSEVERTPVGPEPRAFAYARGGSMAVIVNSVANEIASYRVEDDGGLTELDRVSSGGLNPYDVAVGYNDIVVVTNHGSDQLNTFHIDRRGRLTPLDVAIPGVDPHVVSVSSRGLVAVGNQTERSISLFELDRRGRMIPLGTQALDNMTPRTLKFLGRNLYVALDAPAPNQDIIRRLRVQENGAVEHVSDTPAGAFLTDFEVTPRTLYAVTVNVNGPGSLDDADEVRAYRIERDELILDAAVQTPGAPPSFKQVAVGKRRGNRRPLIVSEYQGGWIRSVIHTYDPGPDEP